MSNVYHIFGPPGCGKTTRIAKDAGLAAQKVGAENVLIASLTKAAAQEIGARNTGIPKKNIGTLHAICYRAAGMPEIAETKIQDWNDYAKNPQHKLTVTGKNSMDDLGLGSYDLAEGDDLLAQMNVLRSMMLTGSHWPVRVASFRDAWFEWMDDCGYLDFTGMIEKALNETYVAPGSPSVMIGDECQDWSKLEMTLFRDVWGERADTVLLAGDPDQTIFRWRGADPRCFIDHEVPEKNKRFLRQSYRLPPGPHQFASRLIARVHDREQVDFAPKAGDDGSVVWGADSYKDPSMLVREIEQQWLDGKTSMVIASCGFVLYELIATLKRLAIPFHNPYRPSQGLWNPLGRAKDKVMPVDRVMAFLAPDPETFEGEAREWDSSDLKKWMKPLKAKGLLRKGVKGKIEAEAYGDLDLDGFIKLFEEEEDAEKALMLDLDWYQMNLLAEASDKMAFPLDIARKRGGKALTVSPKVTVGTIHSVKGGEADLVAVFPDLSKQGFNAYHNVNNANGFEDVVRLFYVAVTRTKDKLILCSPASGKAFEW